MKVICIKEFGNTYFDSSGISHPVGGKKLPKLNELYYVIKEKKFLGIIFYFLEDFPSNDAFDKDNFAIPLEQFVTEEMKEQYEQKESLHV